MAEVGLKSCAKRKNITTLKLPIVADGGSTDAAVQNEHSTTGT